MPPNTNTLIPMGHMKYTFLAEKYSAKTEEKFRIRIQFSFCLVWDEKATKLSISLHEEEKLLLLLTKEVKCSQETVSRIFREYSKKNCFQNKNFESGRKLVS